MEDYLVVVADELQFAADRAVLTTFPHLDAIFRRQPQLDREKGMLNLQSLLETPLQLHRNFHVLVPARDLQLLCAWVTTHNVRPLLKANDDHAYWAQLGRYLGNVQELPRELLREVRQRRRGRRRRECSRAMRRGWYKLWNIPVDRYMAMKRAGYTGQFAQQLAAALQAAGFTPPTLRQLIMTFMWTYFKFFMLSMAIVLFAIALFYHHDFVVTNVFLLVGLVLHYAFSALLAPLGSLMLNVSLGVFSYTVANDTRTLEYATSILTFMHSAENYENAFLKFIQHRSNVTS